MVKKSSKKKCNHDVDCTLDSTFVKVSINGASQLRCSICEMTICVQPKDRREKSYV